MTKQEIEKTVDHTELEPALSGARAHLMAYGEKLQKAQSFIEALLPFVGGALLAWGAAQMELDNNQDGIALILGGILAAALHLVISWIRRDNPISAAIEKLSLAEHAFSQTKIAEAVIGERDRLLLQSTAQQKQVTQLGAQLEDIRTNAVILAQHRTAMLVSLLSINTIAVKLIEETAKTGGKRPSLADRLYTTVSSMRLTLANALNIEPEEMWTFSIYSRERDGDRQFMRRLVALSSDGAEEKDQRRWPKGEGFVGEAWTSGDDLIVPDRRAAKYKNRFHGKAGNKQPSDDEIYRSVAVMPIRFGDTNAEDLSQNYAGCVIATSNKPGRFLDDESDPKALNAALIRQLASTVRLLVLCWKPRNSPHFITD